VDVRYSPERVVKGTAVFFQVGPSTVGEHSVAVLRVEQGDHYIRVTGQEVQEVSLVEISGQMVAQAQGPELDITALATGTYVLRITTPQGIVNRKVLVVK